MVYFIGKADYNRETIEDLRENLFANTEKLVSLFQERLYLADRIAGLKRKKGKPIRDRKRELTVIDDVGNVPHNVRRFLNLLFELTVMEELGTSEREMDSKTAQSVRVSANVSDLEKICARLLCFPGLEVFSISGTKNAFLQEASRRGAHVIEGKCDDYDMRICIGKRGDDCAITIMDGQPMDVAMEFLAMPGEINRILLDGD